MRFDTHPKTGRPVAVYAEAKGLWAGYGVYLDYCRTHYSDDTGEWYDDERHTGTDYFGRQIPARIPVPHERQRVHSAFWACLHAIRLGDPNRLRERLAKLDKAVEAYAKFIHDTDWRERYDIECDLIA